MAAGEYVSVSSQSDTEKADLARERQELSDDPRAEHDELTEIYVKRGVDRITARLVAQQLMEKDPLAAHARDELGISEITTARPVQAAVTSALMFRGRSNAIANGHCSSHQYAGPRRVCSVPGLSRPARCCRRKSGRREHSARDIARDVLGGFGPRYHRRDRQATRHDYLMPRESASASHAAIPAS